MIKKLLTTVWIVLFLLGNTVALQAQITDVSQTEDSTRYNIVPKPVSLYPQKGVFQLEKSTKIYVNFSLDNGKCKALAEAFSAQFEKASGIKLRVVNVDTLNKMPEDGILMVKTGSPKFRTFSESFYSLVVSPKRILLRSYGLSGLFYGIETLKQLLPTEVYSASEQKNVNWNIPSCAISDSARYQYRGLMLDVGRHFHSVATIKRYIDLLAMHKMNTLHWHLTEDQGWRIEIKKYPRLTEVGSKRKETMLGHYKDQKWDGKPYGGFYTQEEIKDVVAYATSKFVTVIPEIEMPGHSLAAIAAYPWLSCDSTKNYEVGTKWGVEKNVYCPTEKTFKFLEDVLTEVLELFPSKYIHIGGDECPKDVWKTSAFCQNLIKEKGLKDEHDLQSYFIQRMEKFLNSKGRQIIGWDEILEGGLAPNATVMSWRGTKGGIEAAKQKHNVVMSPNNFVYLDYYQADPKTTPQPIAIGGLVTLDKIYSYEPSSELSQEEAKYVLGVQANVWTEYISTPEYLDYMTFPRAIALSEIGWSPKGSRNFSDFQRRMQEHYKRLDKLNVNYFGSKLNTNLTK